MLEFVGSNSAPALLHHDQRRPRDAQIGRDVGLRQTTSPLCRDRRAGPRATNLIECQQVAWQAVPVFRKKVTPWRTSTSKAPPAAAAADCGFVAVTWESPPYRWSTGALIRP